MPTLDLLTGALSFLFTILIFSYLLGDNPLFRVGTYIFVGVTGGYVAAVAMWQVIYPRLLYPLAYGDVREKALLAIPFLLSGLLLMKAWPRLSFIGTPAVAYLAGVGAAVAVGGAAAGTLVPQSLATINAFSLAGSEFPLETLVNAGFILLGVVAALAYFHFSAQARPDGSTARFRPLEWLARAGGVFIAITLGVLYAGVFLASLAAFVERIASWSTFFASF
ncbi:MAG TPA: hypothetical protein VIU39_00830 [Anaerolineales bacterium]